MTGLAAIHRRASLTYRGIRSSDP